MEYVKNIVVTVMNKAVAAYLRRNNVRIIAVAGSIGKTSTTHAIRTVLSQQYRVHKPGTAYNTTRSVHLELFDVPFATSTLGWAKAVVSVLWRSLGKAPYEAVVIEIGTDHPGELQTFAWLRPDIGVLTAIAPEHMAAFKTIEAVTKEELAVAGFSTKLIANANAVDHVHLPREVADAAVWYGDDTEYSAANYRIVGRSSKADIIVGGHAYPGLELQVLGAHSLDALLAAAAVARQYNVPAAKIKSGLQAVQPVKGRMRRFEGVRDSVIIDDSYNASPRAVCAALDVLGMFEVPQRIAVLGSMNEMGEYSAQAHREVGEYCDPSILNLVVTIGEDANTYLAEAARKRGCTVESFDSPYAAGALVSQKLKAGGAVLCKGSQNGVFAEEAAKAVLASPDDRASLVRQSAYWMAIKRSQFSDAPEADTGE